MRQSKAKEQILVVAEKMFSEVGYGGLNVNHVAEEAGVSIGTLYYHFPEGKVSILMEMRRQISSRYEIALIERIGERFIDSVVSFDEGLDALLNVLIDVHREGRLVLAAMESKVLGNLGVYDELSDIVDVNGLMEEDSKVVMDVIRTLQEQFPIQGLSLENGVRVSKIIDLLIHRFVYVESLFGSEQEFKKIIKTIIYALLT
jgi:AcrR family transcriptional regulator